MCGKQNLLSDLMFYKHSLVVMHWTIQAITCFICYISTTLVSKKLFSTIHTKLFWKRAVKNCYELFCYDEPFWRIKDYSLWMVWKEKRTLCNLDSEDSYLNGIAIETLQPLRICTPKLLVTCKKKQYLVVHIYHVYKHLDNNLRFYQISKQFKLLTSGNSYIQLPYAHTFTVVQFFTFENCQYNH